jgi:hypothetical protein
MTRPVLLVLSPDAEELAADLRRRYDADYQVVTGEADTGNPVALLIVDERIPDPAR